MDITIMVETKTTPAEAKAKLAKITALLAVFLSELGAEAQIEERIDTYLVPVGPPAPDEEGSGKIPTAEETRVQSRVTVEVAA